MHRIAVVVVLVYILSISAAFGMENEFIEAYKKGDYAAAAGFLEQKLKKTEKAGDKDRGYSTDLYSTSQTLAHIYAWKLNKPEEAIKYYRKASQYRTANQKVFPPVELISIAAVYEDKGDLAKAREEYENFLKILKESEKDFSDDMLVLIADELGQLCRFQLDTISLKEKQKDFKPRLARWKLTSMTTNLSTLPFITIIMVPTYQIDFINQPPQDIASYIKNNPAKFPSMITEFMLIIGSAAGTVTNESEEAMKAYIKKYPESYYSMILRGAFYRFYKENQQEGKANKLLADIEKIAKKRGIEIISKADKRFSSLEATWQTYKKALLEGDIETVMACYVPGKWKERQIFSVLGKEKMREIGKGMGDIQKITGAENEAKYRIRRMEEGKEITYYVHFFNIDGEWKMEEF